MGKSFKKKKLKKKFFEYKIKKTKNLNRISLS